MTSSRDELLGRCVAWFAANGVGDTSLRTLASGVGSSHRMLIYHFGSREGLLAAVVESVEQGERAVLAAMLAGTDDPYAAAQRFWVHVADASTTFAPLFFELSGQAMQGKPWAVSLRQWLGSGWTAALTDLWVRVGHRRPAAEDLARLNLATVRGLLFELAVTGDRSAADRGVALLAETFGRRPEPPRDGIPPRPPA